MVFLSPIINYFTLVFFKLMRLENTEKNLYNLQECTVMYSTDAHDKQQIVIFKKLRDVFTMKNE